MHGKGHAGGDLSDGCPPLTGPRGSPVACQSPLGKREEEMESVVDMYHAVLAPPLAVTPAVLGRLLSPPVSFILSWQIQ